MGTMIRIENNATDPYTASPGGQVDLLTTYAVLAPDSSTSVPVTELHEIRHNNELVGKPALNVNHNAGAYTSSIPLYLPNDAPAGTYQVITTISTGAGSDSRETSFIVRESLNRRSYCLIGQDLTETEMKKGFAAWRLLEKEDRPGSSIS